MSYGNEVLSLSESWQVPCPKSLDIVVIGVVLIGVNSWFAITIKIMEVE